ncbi:L-alanine-DL-glutamate epimerase [Halovenus aranensis]|uniref:L-alanine-DL-glutamate epimerase n=1 Tax=Halovenus aranensis TaxID=890420 RepID=A0A1G8S0E7_9EURY|nr:dipeptide epimerase [Halovenus aranensis]SDJ22265.1 L-alanine-DL-glutamate epimerase [Halovenus aranensis]
MARAITDARFERHTLALSESFTISRGTTEETTVLTVELEDDSGRVGVGAAGPSAYYGETADSVAETLPALLEAVTGVGDPHAQQVIAERLVEVAPAQAAARAAVSIAVHDLAATQVGEPLYRRWGLDPERTPQSSYTVPINSPEEMRDRARRAVERGFDVLKVKLGTDADRERLRAVREGAPEARIRVDANCAWTAGEAVDNTAWLAECGVEFLEQPVAADDIEGLRRVSVEGAVPVAADESCVTAADVGTVADAADVVVVKLMKCGGLRPAKHQILAAKAAGLDVMLGCMIESSASIAGACQLAPLVEYADLDGALLLAEDIYDGCVLSDGRLDLTAVESGTGVR